jgi:hypothetical protein
MVTALRTISGVGGASRLLTMIHVRSSLSE